MSTLVRGRRLNSRDKTILPLAGGRWLRETYLDPVPVVQAGLFEDVLVGIYLVTDRLDRIVWLGQAGRDYGIAARLRDHRKLEGRAEAFYTVRALRLDDFTEPAALSAAEGRAADLLRLRGTLGARRWPRADRWQELCGS